MATKLQKAKSLIENYFNASQIKVFRHDDLFGILFEKQEEWELPTRLSTHKFVEFLLSEEILAAYKIQAEHHQTQEIRFIRKGASIFSIALSLKRKSYLTHGTAVFLHGLNDQIPKTVYVNYEQSPKSASRGELKQESLDKAFSRPQRKSNFSFLFEDYRIVLLNGKSTGRLEVTPFVTPSKEYVDVTKLERTLIDIVVRPVYAGGVHQVLEAYKRSVEIASISTLLSTLKKLDYFYPYHQAIGFYMEKAGYPEKKWTRLLKLGTECDFYLAHNLPGDKKYDSKWRLYYPSGL